MNIVKYYCVIFLIIALVILPEDTLAVNNSSASSYPTGNSVIVLKNGETVGLGCLKEETPPEWIRLSPKIELERESKSSIDLSANFPPINSQGSQGSCTAWASAYYYKSYQEWQEQNWDLNQTDHQFSPAFMYNHINAGEDQGSYISDAFKLLTDLGCCSWADMPYSQYNYTDMPDEESYRNSISYRTLETFAINLSAGVQDLKNLLLNGDATVIGISVYSNFDNIGNYNNTYCINDVYGSMRGGHAVCVCGFDDNRTTADGVGAFKIANSWGTSFGENGYFWMSYEAVQSSLLCHGWAYYAMDKIDYEPVLISTFKIVHEIRAAVALNFGVGNNENPVWDKNFFDWALRKLTPVPFQTTNVIVDLTDGVEYLDQPQTNQVFMRCKDRRFFWHRSSEHAYSGNSWWCADEEIPGYDNGWLMFLDTPEIILGSDGGTFSFILSYALEEPGIYENYNGWDAANVRISTNGFQTWTVLYGSPAYDFTSGYAWAYNGEGAYIPGWGGYQPEWQQASFDLTAWANQTVQLRIAFGSDPGWCSRDNPSYFGLVVDDITVTSDGQTIYYDDAEGAKSQGSIEYFDVEHLIWGLTEVSEETPIAIPETYEFIYVNLFYPTGAMPGDVNSDESIDILDIIRIVNIALGIGDPPTDYELWAGDMNSDNELNVLDIVVLINIILENGI